MITLHRSLLILLVGITTVLVASAADEQDTVTLLACHDTKVVTVVVVDTTAILYLGSNGAYTDKGVVPAERATILREGSLDHLYVVVANYDGNVVIRYMRTELGQAFAVTGNGLATPFSQVPFGIIGGDPARKEGYFAKVKIPRKMIAKLPASKEDLLSLTVEHIQKLTAP